MVHPLPLYFFIFFALLPRIPVITLEISPFFFNYCSYKPVCLPGASYKHRAIVLHLSLAGRPALPILLILVTLWSTPTPPINLIFSCYCTPRLDPWISNENSFSLLEIQGGK